MNLHKKQEEVIRNKARFKVLNWGRRSGKTTVFAYEALGTALTVPNAQITYYAQTLGDARDIAWDIFIAVFGEAVESTNQSLLEIKVTNLKGGTSTINLKGWESVYQAGKGRGTENDLILCDEVAFCKEFLANWDKVLAPTLLTSKGRAVFGSTPNGFNDFYELTTRANTQDGWAYSHASSYDNPANDPAEIERIKKEITEDRFAQEYLADFRRLEGLIYKDFDRQRHTFDGEIPVKVNQYIAGVDFGYRHPCAVIHMNVDYDGNYWVTDEWYKTERTEEMIADYVKSCQFNTVYPDPENQSAIAVLIAKGVAVSEVSKGKGSVKSGIDKVRTLFKQNRLKIHKNCTNLIWELENYQYQDKRANQSEPEEPIKEHDDAVDALRYPIMMREIDDTTSPLESYLRRQAERNYGLNSAR